MPKPKKHDKPIFVRMTKEDRDTVKKASKKLGFMSMSEWARHVLIVEARRINGEAA